MESYDGFKMGSGPKRVRSSETPFEGHFRSSLKRSHSTMDARTEKKFETVIDPTMVDIQAKFHCD